MTASEVAPSRSRENTACDGLVANHPSGGMRVALCAPGEIWGGVEQFVDSLSRYFIRIGVQVVVIVLFDGPLKVKLEAAGVPVYVVRSRRYDWRVVSEIVRVLRQQKVDILHTHGYKATIVGAFAAYWAGARLIRTEHGRVEPGVGAKHFRLRVNNAMEALVSRHAAAAVAFVSKDVQSGSRSAGPRALQQVVYNGLEPLNLSGVREPLEGLDEDPQWFNIGIVGRLVEVKGHVHLLEALRRIKHASKLRVYVFGEGPLEAAYRRLCEEHGLTSIVRFMGFRADVQDYLRRLDLLVMPSLHEGLPFTLLEAMFQKVPVVASRVGGLAEVIEHDVTGLLVERSDHISLAAAIERLYSDAALRHRLTENAHRVVCERFLVDNMAIEYPRPLPTSGQLGNAANNSHASARPRQA